MNNQGEFSGSRYVILLDSTNDMEIAHQKASTHSKHIVASEANLHFDGEKGTESEIGNWCWADGDVNGNGFNNLLVTVSHYPDNAGDWFGDCSDMFADINKDGYDDIIIGARYYRSGRQGDIWSITTA